MSAAMQVIKKRDASLDVIRSLAAFCVVINHSVESIYPLNIDFLSTASLHIKIFCYAMFSFGRIGVPLFIILSGYLLLPREYTREATLKFYKTNLFSLFLTWEIWILIYNVFLSYFNHTPFDFSTYWRNALFLQHTDLSHTWYIPMILGMYLFIPLVARVLHTLSDRAICILLSFTYIYCFLVPSVNLFFNAFHIAPITNQLDLSFGGNGYGLYLIVGYLIAHRKKSGGGWLKTPLTYFLFTIVFLLVVAAQIVLCNSGTLYNVWYDFALMPVLGITLFISLQNTKWERIRLIATPFSICSFGIYLLHRPLQMVIVRSLGSIADRSSWTLIVALITYLISFLAVVVISQIPHCGKLLFLKKDRIPIIISKHSK